MDCSGLVCELLQANGLLENNSELNAQGLYAKFMKDSEQATEPSFGSLIFYGKDFQSISHVAFGVNSFQMIEAGGGNNTVSNSDIAEKTNAYVKIRPYRHRSDLLGIINPKYDWREE